MPATHNGMILIKPSSVDKTGASSVATINALGSVDFSLCATLSLNGVFSSMYDNYMVVIRHQHGSSATNISMPYRLRGFGADATAAEYNLQYLRISSTTVDPGRVTKSTTGGLSNTVSNLRNGLVLYLYGPALPQPTASRSVCVVANSDAEVIDFASTHQLSESYDGISILPASGSVSGLIKVYGLRQ
jgi:hypothetical protein